MRTEQKKKKTLGFSPRDVLMHHTDLLSSSFSLLFPYLPPQQFTIQLKVCSSSSYRVATMAPTFVAFVSPALPLRQPALQHSVAVNRRPLRVQCQPRMSSTITVASQVVAVAAASAGAFYVIRGKKLPSGIKLPFGKKKEEKKSDEKGGKSTDDKKATKSAGKGKAEPEAKEDAKPEGKEKGKVKVRARGPVKGEEEGGKKTKGKKEKPSQPEKEDGGIIGLTTKRGLVFSQLDPKLEQALKTPAPDPVPPVFPSVGTNIADYMEGKEAPPKKEPKRVEEDFAWVGSMFSGLDAVKGVLLADKSDKVLLEAGPLITGDTKYLGEVVSRVRKGKNMEVLTDRARDYFPFLAKGANGVAVLPAGDDGIVLVLASEEGKFFGPREERMATAVATRLALRKKATAVF